MTPRFLSQLGTLPSIPTSSSCCHSTVPLVCPTDITSRDTSRPKLPAFLPRPHPPALIPDSANRKPYFWLFFTDSISPISREILSAWPQNGIPNSMPLTLSLAAVLAQILPSPVCPLPALCPRRKTQWSDADQDPTARPTQMSQGPPGSRHLSGLAGSFPLPRPSLPARASFPDPPSLKRLLVVALSPPHRHPHVPPRLDAPLGTYLLSRPRVPCPVFRCHKGRNPGCSQDQSTHSLACGGRRTAMWG